MPNADANIWKAVRRAVFVITAALLAAFMIVGTLLPQNQPLAHYYAFMPALAPLIEALQLHDVYNSPLFSALWGLLTLQLLERACLSIINRSKSGGAAQAYAAALMYAGSALAALALLISHSSWSFTGELRLTEGNGVRIPEMQRPAFLITLEKLLVQTDGQCRPISYTSVLSVREDGGHTAELRSSVNHPASYRGITFYQSGCGISAYEIVCKTPQGSHNALITVQNEQETALLDFHDGSGCRYLVHRYYPQAQWQADKITSHGSTPGQGAALIFEINLDSSGLDHSASPIIAGYRRLGWITSGRRAVTSAGSQLYLGKQHVYSVIRYTRDRGYPCLLAGFILLFVGLAWYYYILIKRNSV